MTNISEKLEMIKNLNYDGKFEQALNELNDINEIDNLSNDEKKTLKKELINAYIRTADYQKSIKIANELREITHNENDYVNELIAISKLIESLTPIGNFSASLKYFQEGKELIEKFDVNNDELWEIKAYFLFVSGITYQKKNELGNALNLFQDSLKIRENINNEMGIAKCLLHCGNIALLKNEYEDAKGFFRRSIYYSSKFPLNMNTAWAYVHNAWAYHQDGNLDMALDNAMKSLKIAEKLKNKHCKNYIYEVLGHSYLGKGKFSSALEWFNKSLFLRKIQGNPIDIAYSYCSIGTAYSLKGDIQLAHLYFGKTLEIPEIKDDPILNTRFLVMNGKLSGEQGEYGKSIKYLEDAIVIALETNDCVSVARCYHYLIYISLNQNEFEKAKAYLKNSEQLFYSNAHNNLVRQFYEVDQGLILKYSPRYRDKMIAQNFFSGIVQEGIIHIEITVEAMLNLCESLIFELETSGDESILKEINYNINQLLEIAEQESSSSLLSETLFFKAKLSLIELNIEDARRLLTESQKIADDQGLTRLAGKISNDHDSLLSQMENWEDFKKNKTSLQERVKYAKLNFLFSKMVRKLDNSTQEDNELPFFLVIFSNKGLDLFSLVFKDQKTGIKKRLISSFLSAFDTFGKEALSSTCSIDRIKYGEDTIIVRDRDPFKFGYAFKGFSYNAIKNLEFFIEMLTKSQHLWNCLIQSELTGRVPTSDELSSIQDMANKIFS